MPVPPLQIPVVVAPETVPERTELILFLQTLKSIPALTIGELVKTIVMLSLAAKHEPLLVDVKYNFTCPANTSAVLGMYPVFNCILLGLKLPDPFEVHFPVVDVPAIVPETATVGLFAHTEKLGGPASDVGTSVIVTFIVSLARGQIPLAVDVNTNLIEPAAVSAELG